MSTKYNCVCESAVEFVHVRKKIKMAETLYAGWVK